MYSHVVIPVDGSDESKVAARHGLGLATVFDASVTVLHVVEQKRLRLASSAKERDRLRERGESILEEIEAIASEFAHSVRFELREGRPATQISRYAAEAAADLVVVGRQGLTGLGKRLLGGVTEQVLHQSDIPVFVVPDTARMDGENAYSRILVPTDGSENAKAATRHGVAIATNYDSTVSVLNVVDLQSAGGMFNAGGLETEFIDRLKAEGEQAVEDTEADIHELAPALTVETAVMTMTSFEGTAGGIREYVTENDIGMVVMGSHGRSNLQRQVLGSVAATVLRTVGVPVLVVKRPS